jgi:uncharacterized secreted protein with C-terminal beta-propeller domain
MDSKTGIYTLSFLATLLTACGGGGGGSTATSPDPAPGPDLAPTGLLIPVESNSELLATVQRGFTNTLNNNIARTEELAMTAPTEQDSSESSYTTTYTLENNVDEHDAVKYDGEHLFIAPSRSMDCCFIVDDLVMVAEAEEDIEQSDPIPESQPEPQPEPQESDRSIRILETDPENAGAAEVGTIELDNSRTVEGLYTQDDQLVSISSSGWWGIYGESFARVSNWEGQTTALDIYDISDITAPTPQMQIEFQGGFVNSRKKGDIIYLVARHTPNIDGFDYYPMEEAISENETLLDELSIEDILPKVSVNGVESLLVDANECLITDPDNELSTADTGYPTLTLLIAVNIVDQSIANATCYLEPTDGIYVSENAIYLTQVDYRDAASRTLIHSYELSEDLTYQGSGVAEGSLYLNGDRDFRINEYEGHLRIVTTERTGDSSDSVDHRLSILKLNTQELEMELVATLPNKDRPEAIGKPNEDLYGVRFMGDTAYLVTFERIDPLYVLDLSTPTDPVIAGELMVTGFSDFLHPVSDQLLMGLGQDENGLTKLELFNVENMSSPYSLGTVTLGIEDGVIGPDSLNWSYSEARYNRHAFTYQVISDTQDRFLVPATLSFYNEQSGYQDEDRLYLFEINDKNTALTASINKVGYITAKRNERWYSSRNRGVIDGDAVYYINDSSVWSTQWSNPTQQEGPL